MPRHKCSTSPSSSGLGFRVWVRVARVPVGVFRKHRAEADHVCQNAVRGDALNPKPLNLRQVAKKQTHGKKQRLEKQKRTLNPNPSTCLIGRGPPPPPATIRKAGFRNSWTMAPCGFSIKNNKNVLKTIGNNRTDVSHRSKLSCRSKKKLSERLSFKILQPSQKNFFKCGGLSPAEIHPNGK